MTIQRPPTEFILRKCWMKEAFDCRRRAELAAKRINQGPRARRPVSAFRCPCCQAFHIGGARKPMFKEGR